MTPSNLQTQLASKSDFDFDKSFSETPVPPVHVAHVPAHVPPNLSL